MSESNDLTKKEEELEKLIDKLNYVINGLENHDQFNVLLGMFKERMEQVDSIWQSYPINSKELEELRVSKMASLSVLNIIQHLRHDLEQAQKFLTEIRHPDLVQGGYYDNE